MVAFIDTTMKTQDIEHQHIEENEDVHPERRYDMCTGDGAGNRSDFSDKGQRP